MQPIIIITITILSFLFTISSNNSFIHQVECIPVFDESIPSKSSSSSPPSPSPSLRTTSLILPPLSSNAPTPYSDDPMNLITPDSAPIDMQDADGDPIDLPLNFNPFDRSHQNDQSPRAVDPEVKKTCGATDNPDLCISSLKPFLMQNNNNNNNKEPKKTDTLSLLEMQVKVTLEATQHAVELSSNPNVGQLTDDDMDSLRDCKELYNDALDNLKEVIKALNSKDVGTINSMLSAVVSDFSTCNDGFQESGSTSPLADYGNQLSKLVSNCLATASLIKN